MVVKHLREIKTKERGVVSAQLENLELIHCLAIVIEHKRLSLAYILADVLYR